MSTPTPIPEDQIWVVIGRLYVESLMLRNELERLRAENEARDPDIEGAD